jgi:CheY-like chemotaxis protein
MVNRASAFRDSSSMVGRMRDRSAVLRGIGVMAALTEEPAVVLVVDPDPLMLTGVAAALDLSGYECHMARSGEVAMQAARAQRLDLVICDSDLPDQSGFELCAEIRRLPGCDRLPFLFVSAGQTDDMVQRVRQAGGVYYLRKPYDPEVLIALVERSIWLPHLVSARIDGVKQHRPLGAPSGGHSQSGVVR